MGDGNFRWWMAIGKGPESYTGPYDSREQAVMQALSEDGRECGYTIVEADSSKAGHDVFCADWTLERYEECNEECWGEDGADIEATPAQKRDLEAMLAAALEAWFDKHGNRPRPWAFGTMRNEEYVPPEPLPATRDMEASNG